MKFLSQEEYKKYHENLRKQGYFVEKTSVLPKAFPSWKKNSVPNNYSPEIISFFAGLNG